MDCDHAAVRAGLTTLLEEEARLAVLPPARGATEGMELAQRQVPDLALVDVSLVDGSGLELKQLDAPPGVLLYTAATGPRGVSRDDGWNSSAR